MMNHSGPTPVSASVSTTRLAQNGIQLRKQSDDAVKTHSHSSETITDTLETQEREPDGRGVFVPTPSDEDADPQERLDLTG